MSKKILSVSDVTRQVKRLLESELPSVYLSGEISNLTRHGSGHWYFTLKDARAQLRCAMFKSRNSRVTFMPKAGQAVVVRGSLSLYEAQGSFQLIVDSMQPEGAGALQLAYEELKEKLKAEGLFSEDQKQPLPRFPRSIGVITSPTGAAIADVLTVLNRRYPLANVVVVPAVVQGNEAPKSLLKALTHAIDYNAFDVLIIGRGGGSIEDLWAFNDESLARAIAQCPIPIISAVGHDTDFTIADFVADYRAPTPSAAAEVAVPDAREWQQTFDYLYSELFRALQQRQATCARELSHLVARLRNPLDKLGHSRNCVNDLANRLNQSMMRSLTHKHDQVSQQQQRLMARDPKRQLANHRRELYQLHSTLQKAVTLALEKKRIAVKHSTTAIIHQTNSIRHLNTQLVFLQRQLHSHSPKRQINQARQQLIQQYDQLKKSMFELTQHKKQHYERQVALLDAISPLRLLSKGYCFIQREGRVITETNQLAEGDTIETQLHDGKVFSTVTKKTLGL